MQKKAAEDSYFAAIDHQKEKHQPYALLHVKSKPKQQSLQQLQVNNRMLEEEVGQGTRTLQQWQSQNHPHSFYQGSVQLESHAVINQFLPAQQPLPLPR